MLNVIVWELKQRRSAIFWWVVGSLVMTCLLYTSDAADE